MGLPWTKDRPDAETLFDNTQHSQAIDINAKDGLETTIPAREGQQTHNLDRATISTREGQQTYNLDFATISTREGQQTHNLDRATIPAKEGQ